MSEFNEFQKEWVKEKNKSKSKSSIRLTLLFTYILPVLLILSSIALIKSQTQDAPSEAVHNLATFFAHVMTYFIMILAVLVFIIYAAVCLVDKEGTDKPKVAYNFVKVAPPSKSNPLKTAFNRTLQIVFLVALVVAGHFILGFFYLLSFVIILVFSKGIEVKTKEMVHKFVNPENVLKFNDDKERILVENTSS